MNWGNRILLVILVFLACMGVMIYVAMQQTNEMLDENYYDKEMVYQQIVEGKTNLEKTGDSVSVRQDEHGLNIVLPSFSVAPTGTIQLLRPAEQRLDVSLNIANNKEYTIANDKLQKGAYVLRTRWKSGNMEYYEERDIMVQ